MAKILVSRKEGKQLSWWDYWMGRGRQVRARWRTSLVTQWSRLWVSTAGDTGSISGWRIKIPHVRWHVHKTHRLRRPRWARKGHRACTLWPGKLGAKGATDVPWRVIKTCFRKGLSNVAWHVVFWIFNVSLISDDAKPAGFQSGQTSTHTRTELSTLLCHLLTLSLLLGRKEL